MALHVVRLPDVGEGVAEAELVEWRVEVGDAVTPDSVLAEVLTDKATVEISSPVAGTITFRNGEPGDVLAIGSDFVGVELHGNATDAASSGPSVAANAPAPAPPPPNDSAEQTRASRPAVAAFASVDRAVPSRAASGAARPMAAPAVRQRAKELGIDLRLVRGSGPGGRIVHADLDTFSDFGHGRSRSIHNMSTTTTPLRGVRKRIAQKMTTAWSRIPHISYIDEVDVTEVEALRTALSRRAGVDAPKLTLLPFLVRALVLACRDQPVLNSTFDDEADGGSGALTTHGGLHVGIATQTSKGLIVPVLRHAELLGLWEIATEITRVTSAARTGDASREEVSGSTITITSLGALGGLATTPILNHPEVAIVGVNKMQVRPVWRDQAFVPRTMLNLSSSFDHRIVDGWVAATFIQRIKELVELPALLFLDDEAP